MLVMDSVCNELVGSPMESHKHATIQMFAPDHVLGHVIHKDLTQHLILLLLLEVWASLPWIMDLKGELIALHG